MPITSDSVSVNMMVSPSVNEDSTGNPRPNQHAEQDRPIFTTTTTNLSENGPSWTTAASSSKTDQAHHDDTTSGRYPANTLALMDSTPIPTSQAENYPGGPTPLPPSPTHPTPIHHSSTRRQSPTYELRSIFPSNLPPRPPPKRNFLTRLFRSRARLHEDQNIELGRQGVRVESFWAFILTDWHFWLAVLLWVVCIGLAGIVYQGVKAHEDGHMGGMDGKLDLRSELGGGECG